MKSFIPLLLALFLFSACGSKTSKHFDFEYLKQSYSWGTIAIWTLGTSKSQDEQTTLIGSPYNFRVEFKTHEQVSGCFVSIDAIRLERVDKRRQLLLDTPKAVELKMDTSRSQASRFFDSRTWYSTIFSFDKLQLDHADYELDITFDFKGNCGKTKGENVKLPLKKVYYETTDSILYQ